MSVLGILDMFDKLDDIVYEPVKMICNWAQEPLRALESKRKKDEARNEMELEVEKQERLARLQADQRMWNAEVDAFIADSEIDRNKRIFEAMTEYRRLMEEDIKDIAYQISCMEIDLVKQVYDLVEVKLASLEKMRAKAVENRNAELTQIKQLHDDGIIDDETRRDMTKDAVTFTLDFSKQCQLFIEQLKVDTERICIANSERTKVASETIEGIFRNWGKVIAVGDATPVPLPGASSATKKIEG